MKEQFLQIMVALVIISIVYGIYVASNHYHKGWSPRGDEIMYDSSNYQLKVK